MFIGNDRPLVLIGGVNVLEDGGLALEVAAELAAITARLGMPWVFKASWDKANRSSHQSWRGPGLTAGLRALAAVKRTHDVAVLTDVHEPSQAEPVAAVADWIQVPAFLVRQTDLIQACCAAGRPLHLKKMQTMAPTDMAHVVDKCAHFGQRAVAVCERGTAFGYGNLVVDPLGFPALKALGVPVTFDVTHALQLPGARASSAGGRRHLAPDLAVAGVSQGIAALFLETHPDPDRARCDGPSATPLGEVEALLRRVLAVDRAVKTPAAAPGAPSRPE